VAVGLLAMLGLSAMGCGPDSDDEASGRDSPGEDTSPSATDDEGCDVDGGVAADDAEPETSVEVSLTDYGVSAQPPEVPAGATELVVANDGRIWHELAVVRFDGDPGALPLDQFGGADETRIPEEAIVGKVREFLAGTTCRATFDLEPGRYALICNLVDDGSNPHYSQGMYTGFTVT
jgi:hypothetical protein